MRESNSAATDFVSELIANPSLEKELRLPLPEMTFGHNSLVIQHPLVTLSFDTLGALRAVPVGEGWEERCGGGVLVSMADAWKNRKVEDVAAKPVRPHDWTFSTCFNGATTAGFEGGRDASMGDDAGDSASSCKVGVRLSQLCRTR